MMPFQKENVKRGLKAKSMGVSTGLNLGQSNLNLGKNQLRPIE